MKQLSIFYLPEEIPRFKTTDPADEKWDRWWLALLREPRAGWEDRDEFDPPAGGASLPKQEAIPGLS